MSTKSKQVFIAAAVILIFAVIAVIILFGRDGGDDYEKQLAEAEMYLNECDYDNAVAIYNRIIAEDHTCAEAYAGLSEAYFARERTDKALEVLEKGAENTDNNEIILSKFNELFPDFSYAQDSDEAEAEDITEENGMTEDMEAVSESESETDIPQTSETTVPDSTETDETTVPTTEETTVPTTAVTTVPTTVTTTAPTTVRTAAPATVPIVVTTTAATTVTTTAATTTVTTTAKPVEVTVPDFTLMTVDEAYAWCSKNNLTLNVIGDGDRPRSQSPAPGAVIEENSEVIVKC